MQPETKRATSAARTYPEDRVFPSGAIRKTLERCALSATWRSHLGIDCPGDVCTSEGFRSLPFMTKASFRNAAPLAFSCAPERDIVRIHSTSGTTGEPVIVPYTAGDVAVFREIMARCLRMAGVGPEVACRITPGYGLWTPDRFPVRREEIGAMAVPLGPQPLPKQLEFMRRLRPTVLIGTRSFAFLVGEEMARSGSRPPFRIAILGAEQWWGEAAKH
jgi:phenylacetate-CoA ligase